MEDLNVFDFEKLSLLGFRRVYIDLVRRDDLFYDINTFLSSCFYGHNVRFIDGDLDCSGYVRSLEILKDCKLKIMLKSTILLNDNDNDSNYEFITLNINSFKFSFLD